jgi:hypothetical protein
MKKLVFALLATAGLSVAVLSTADAMPFIKYGAIAYDMATGRYGFSYNYDADWQARNRALGECGWGGCKVYASFHNSCGALATDDNQHIFGWGVSYDRSEAQQRALYECRVRGGNCTIKVWSCTSR